MEHGGQFSQRWERLATTTHRQRTVDEDRSLVFHLAALDPTRAPARVVAWLGQCARVGRFVSETGREPREHVEDPGERRLGAWVRRQREKYHRQELSGYQREMLAQTGAWRSLQDRGDRFEARAFAYAEFLDRRGRRPSIRSEDAQERTLAQWMSRQRRIARAGRLPPEREQLIEQALDKHHRPPESVRH